jgi:hypothetical protein
MIHASNRLFSDMLLGAAIVVLLTEAPLENAFSLDT